MLRRMAKPLRIASLLSSATEMLYGLGLGEQVVAVSHECDWPPEVAAKPKATVSHIDSAAPSRAIDDEVRSLVATGGSLYGVDADLLARLAPDVIVTQAQCDVCAVRYEDVLSAMRGRKELAGSRVIPLNPASLADVLADIIRLGAATDRAAEAERWTGELTARVDRVRTKTADLTSGERPRTAIIEWTDPIMLAGNWMPELLDWAGGVCPLARGGEHSRYVDWEKIVAFDPQLIVIAACGFDLERTLREAETLRALPGWKELSAVRAGRVAAVDGNAFFNRAGPRLVESLEMLAHFAQPERFNLPGGDMRRWARWGC
jgi:iron complex transport system substrate-binding protein